MSKKDLKVTLIGEDKTGGAFGSASKNATGFGDNLKKAGKGIALAFGGAAVAGVAGFAAGLVNGAKDAANMQRILAQTEAVVKSTGGAAGITTSQIDAFATALEKTTGIEAEAIVEGQNMLLTFTNIKNGIGEGNQVFDQASTVLADMSTAMGTDMSSSAVLLGKALNDPLKGVGALSKAGVQLTDGQKEQIKGFVESGDAMSAQKIILGELTTQFGGSAQAFGETLPGQVAKAKNAFGEMFETLAVGVLPTVSAIVTSFTAAIPQALAVAQGAFTALGTWWASNGPAITAAAGTMAAGMVAAFQTVAGIVTSTVAFFREHDNAAKVLAGVVAAVAAGVAAAWVAQGAVATVNAGKSVLAWISTATASTTSATIQSKSTAQIVVGWVAAAAGAMVNALKVAAGWALTGVSAIQAGAIMVAQVAVQVARWAFLGAQSLLHAAKVAAAWLIAMGPIGLVIAAVVGLVVIVVKNWDTIRAKTVELWNAVKAATTEAWTAIKGAFTTGLNAVKAVVTAVLGAIQTAFTTYFSAYKAVVSAALGAIQGVVIGAFNAIRGAISGAMGAIQGVVSGAWGAIKSATASGVGGVLSVVGSLPGRIKGALGNLGGLLVNAGRELMSGLARGIGEKIASVVAKVREAAQKIKDLLPGSPVKDGPLTAWNNGGAGKRLMEMLAGGIASKQGMVSSALRGALDAGDLAGMRVGGAAYVNRRLEASSAPGGSVGAGRSLTVNITGQVERIDEARLMTLMQRAERLAGV